MRTSAPGAAPMDELHRRVQAALGDGYAVLRALGSGGMGTVFLADDLKHGRQVAIKVMNPLVAQGIGEDRFVREVGIVAKLSHPHLVPLFDSGESDGLLYYVMPHVDGGTLKDRLAEPDPLSPREAVRLVREVADALKHAHAQGIIHRDVKPSNILLSDGHALLADFGVALPNSGEGPRTTHSGGILGTPLYMSPEQITGGAPVGPRSDQYALGCVLYEALAGKPPFLAGTTPAVLAGHIQGAIPPLTSVRNDVSPGLARVVGRALAKRPEDRYPDMAAFQKALEDVDEEISSSSRAAPLKRWMALLAVAVVVLAVVNLRGRFTANALADRTGSVVVLPFGDPITSPEERTLLIDLAGEVTRQLNQWDSVRAVPQLALAGVAFDLGQEGPVYRRLDEALDVARAVGVEHLVSLTVRVRGDSAVVSATSVASATGREVGRPLVVSGLASDVFSLAARVVHALLGLEGPVDEIEELRRQSGDPQAIRDHRRGLDALGRWRLAEAEEAFRGVVARDSTLPMAWHHLALTRYWRATDDPAGLAGMGPELAALTSTALRLASGLAERDRLHVEAFHGFLQGDYAAARRGYAQLVGRDSTDVFALLLQGMVEYRDPWLVEAPDGSFRPAQRLNLAVQAFQETVRLSPDFSLGYGHLFDITRSVLSAADARTGTGFERPRDELLPPWEEVTPRTQEAFYPVFLDTLAWLTPAELDALPSGTAAAGAQDLLERSMRRLRRWAAFSPKEPRPLEELVTWTVRQRERLPREGSRRVADSLAAEASVHAAAALALNADTTAVDLLRFGALAVASGVRDEGVAWATQGLARAVEEGRALPRWGINPFLASGEAAQALRAQTLAPQRRWYLADPETGELFDDGGAEPLIDRIEILGALGTAGPALAQAFVDLDRLWSPPHFTRPRVQALRRHFLGRVTPALALSPSVRGAWMADGVTSPALQAFDAAGPSATVVVETPDSTGAAPRWGPSSLYTLAVAAQERGDHATALRLLERLGAMRLSLEGPDPGWGLEVLAHFRAGISHEAQGDAGAALDAYRTFLDRWGDGDDLTRGTIMEAQSAVARLASPR